MSVLSIVWRVPGIISRREQRRCLYGAVTQAHKTDMVVGREKGVLPCYIYLRCDSPREALFHEESHILFFADAVISLSLC